MNDYTEVEISNWNRKEHFFFFQTFEDPIFGLTAEIDCSPIVLFSKNNKISLYLLYLFLSLKTANELDEFRMRIIDKKPVIFPQIHAGPTIFREDKTFAFSFLRYHENFKIFLKKAKEEHETVMKSTGLNLNDPILNIIHYTTIPWVRFTSLKHPQNSNSNLSIPKISFGKIYSENKRFLLPIQILAHHSLMDGYHIANFINEFQNKIFEFPLKNTFYKKDGKNEE